ncbi:MAG: hypothetical protein IPG17_30515 [Sandaracinaceae bacterium]|nr:hypothetical protein [Sandaracinaceae bacterium]
MQILPSLYHAGADAARAALATVPDGVTTVMLIGHNPGWEEALTALCGARETLPTASVAMLQRDDETAWAGRAGFELVRVLRPRVDLG